MRTQGRTTLTLQAGDPLLIPPRTPHDALDVGPGTGQMLLTRPARTGRRSGRSEDDGHRFARVQGAAEAPQR
jgi:hypothetical protein